MLIKDARFSEYKMKIIMKIGTNTCIENVLTLTTVSLV